MDTILAYLRFIIKFPTPSRPFIDKSPQPGTLLKKQWEKICVDPRGVRLTGFRRGVLMGRANVPEGIDCSARSHQQVNKNKEEKSCRLALLRPSSNWTKVCTATNATHGDVPLSLQLVPVVSL